MAPAADFERSDMVPTTRRDITELTGEFRALAATIHDRDVRRIVRAVFGQDGFFDRFCGAPGGQTYHHAYVGGLLEHTVAVGRLCDSLAQTYEHVNRDLLLGAALMHDIGKVDELTCYTVI
jgi:3'-5' exoribonuclease